jgi:NADH-quinone oxidoreductase subunit I
MLFLFVLMLVGVDSSDSLVETIKGQKWVSLLLAFGLGGLIFTKEQLLAPLQEGMLAAPHPMVDGMEERDYYEGKVSKATPEQERWVSEHHAEPEDGLAWTGDPVEGVDTVAGGRQATRDTDKAVKR